MTTSNPRGATAFPESEKRLRESVQRAALDKASFRRPIRRCPKGACRGMCCYDGVYLPQEQEFVLTALARREHKFFESLGVDVTGEVFVDGCWRGCTGRKSVCRQRNFSKEVPGYPAHFSDTACIFLTEQGCCSFQILAEAQGLHPWYYKPIACWLFPVHLEGGKVWLPDSKTDTFSLPDYPGYVSQIFCGRECSEGEPAYKVLRPELEFLGKISERDLINLLSE